MPRRILSLLFCGAVLIAAATESSCKKNADTAGIDNKLNAEIEANLDNRMDYFIQMYGSREKLEKATGKKYSDLREEFRGVITEKLIAEKQTSN